MEEKQKSRYRAVALRHDLGTQQSPEVVATGSGEVAKKILDLAQFHGIPVHRDPDLIHVLSHLDVGESIPPELYRVVAEILSFIYRVNGEYKS